MVRGKIPWLAGMLATLLSGSVKLPLQLLGGQLVGVIVIHIGDRIGRACGKTEVELCVPQGTGQSLFTRQNRCWQPLS